jgi:hypothetical protein
MKAEKLKLHNMKVEELKLYNKYESIFNPSKKLIYIGIYNDKYIFLYKNTLSISFNNLKRAGFDPEQIVKDLNLQTEVSKGKSFIKGYFWVNYSKEQIESFFKPMLKDKLKNIINR